MDAKVQNRKDYVLRDPVLCSDNSKFQRKKECCLIFIGETGSGKTTLLKSLEDFINDTSFEKRHLTPKSSALGKSQTQECNQYTLSNSKWVVNIIDTPGLADTEGLEADEKHLKHIVEFLINKGEMNAICFVLKASTNRATINVLYVINELQSMLPKNAKNNFIVCLTNTSMPIPSEDVTAVIKKLNLPEENVMSFDNVAYEMRQYDPKTLKGAQIEKQIRNAFEMNKANLELLLETAQNYTLYRSDGIKVLKIKRDKLKEEVAVLNLKMEECIRVQSEMIKTMGDLSNSQKEIENNKDFELKTTIDRKIPYKKNGSITTHCNNCKKSCHVDCGLNYGDNLEQCTAISKGYCQSCHCSVNYHCHLGWDFNVELVTVINIDKEKLAKLQTAEEKNKYYESEKLQLKMKIEQEEKDKEKCADRIQSLYFEINEIALLGHNYVYEEFLNEQIKSVEKNEKSSEIKQEKISFLQKCLLNFQRFKNAIMRK